MSCTMNPLFEEKGLALAFAYVDTCRLAVEVRFPDHRYTAHSQPRTPATPGPRRGRSLRQSMQTAVVSFNQW